MAAESDRVEVLTAARLWPPMMEALRGAFMVHDRTHQSDPAAFAQVAPRIRAIAASGESKVSRELMAQLPALEIVSVFGVGYDGIDVAAARERGIAVTHTPNVLNDEVADLAMALVLAVSRRLIEADRYVRSGAWANGPMPLARKVSGARMGIVGLGRIGVAIAKRAEAFGMSIAYTSRNARPDSPYPYFPSAEALAREVDFLVVITPGGDGDAQAHRRQGPRRARQQGLSRQRRARIRRRRAGARAGAVRRHDRRRRPRRVRERAERAERAARARQRRPHAARRQRDVADAPGDGRPRVRQPRGALRRAAAALARAMTPAQRAKGAP